MFGRLAHYIPPIEPVEIDLNVSRGQMGQGMKKTSNAPGAWGVDRDGDDVIFIKDFQDKVR
jgi:hypothetical protein